MTPSRLTWSLGSVRGQTLIGLLGPVALLWGALWWVNAGAVSSTAPVVAQGVVTATPSSAAPVPDVAGRWAVTRSWYRRCPGCGMSVVRTKEWQVSVLSDTVRIAGGPRGSLRGDGAGGGLLELEGLETMAGATLRFRYATVRVAADGMSMEGGFGGSERLANPCGSTPPVVTCFADGGWLRATRLDATPRATGVAPPAPATATTGPPGSTATSAPQVTPTARPVSTLAPSATWTPVPTGTSRIATATPDPPGPRVWLPHLELPAR